MSQTPRNPNTMLNYSADSLIYLVSEVQDGKGLDDPALAEKLIAAEMDDVLDNTAVGAILLNTNYQVSYIPSKTHDTAWKRLSGEEVSYADCDAADHWQKHFIRAHKAGIEPYEIAMRHIRKHGAEVWFSIRVNDFHYLNIPPVIADFWKQHPEYRERMQWGVFDYSFPEVRKYRADYVWEMCRDYDIDGIELDMIRCDRFFPENDTRPAAEKSAILTAFLRELRDGIDRISDEKGHAIQVAARVYSDPETDAKRFFDPAAWIQNGSIDKLILTNFFVPGDFDIPIEEWREKLSKEGVTREFALILGTDYSVRCVRWGDERQRFVPNDSAILCAFSASAFARGADGVYLFNRFLMEKKLDFAAFADAKRANAHDRRHVRTYRDPGDTDPMPWALAAGEEKTFRWHTASAKATATVQLGLTADSAIPKVFVNGNPAGEAVPETEQKPDGVARFVRCKLPEGALKDGWQEITVKAEKPVCLVWFEIDM